MKDFLWLHTVDWLLTARGGDVDGQEIKTRTFKNVNIDP